MRKMMLFLFLLYSYQAFAFHSVTEVLPSGKILICKSYNEIKKGNVAQVYSQTSARSRLYPNQTFDRVSEFSLPATGQKIKLLQESLTATKYFTHYEVEEVGSAVITDEALIGESRHHYSSGKSRFSRWAEEMVKISQQDDMNIRKNCLVAIPDKGVQVRENLMVKW